MLIVYYRIGVSNEMKFLFKMKNDLSEGTAS